MKLLSPLWKFRYKKWGYYKKWEDTIYVYFTKIERSKRIRKYIPFFKLLGSEKKYNLPSFSRNSILRG